MSQQYSDYLKAHINGIQQALRWIEQNIPEFIENNRAAFKQIGLKHDLSKRTEPEYSAYDAYFYSERTPEVIEKFDHAWLHHIHNNPHHWQYWILNNDSGVNKVLDMPHIYILEMVCDWWAFSWIKGDLYEIFNWYEKNRDLIQLSLDTRLWVEELLKAIKTKLDQQNNVEEK